MGRRTIKKTYKNTSAKGDRTAIEGNRFFVRIELVSIKMLEEADKLGRTSEIYFKVGGKGLLRVKQRVPVKGTIYLDRNEVFKPTDGLTLYADFVEDKDGGTVEVPLKIYDQDAVKDDLLMSTQIGISLGQGKEYLSFDEGGVKIKVSAAANRTRY